MICPIGLKCLERICPNRLNCLDLTYSWGLPYYFEDGVLIVRQWGWRYEWHEEDQGLGWGVPRRCSLPSGHYMALDNSYHDSEMNKRLIDTWVEAGWLAAVPLPNQECLE